MPADSVMAFDCSKKYCSQMSSCKEAVYKLKTCGFKQLDRDNDGIPCEVKCGDLKRLSGITLWSQQGGGLPELRGSVGNAKIINISPACKPKKTCKQMKSCAEVAFYLNLCPGSKLALGENNTPCPSVCKRQVKQ